MKKSYIIIAVVIAIMIIAMGIYAVVNNNQKDEGKRKNIENTNEESNSISENIEKNQVGNTQTNNIISDFLPFLNHFVLFYTYFPYILTIKQKASFKAASTVSQ